MNWINLGHHAKSKTYSHTGFWETKWCVLMNNILQSNDNCEIRPLKIIENNYKINKIK